MTDILPSGAGELLTDEPERFVQVKTDREELAVTQSRYAAGEAGPGEHFHREHCDCFYVLDGKLVFEIEDERVEVVAGGFVAVPPLVVHTFRNEGPGDAYFLNVHAPGKGFVQHLRDGGRSEDFDTFDPSER